MEWMFSMSYVGSLRAPMLANLDVTVVNAGKLAMRPYPRERTVLAGHWRE
jgi:hypothetical protein